MAVQNTLQKKTQAVQSAVTEYESNGEKVKLSPQIIKQYLVSGGGNVTNEEIMMFLSMCRFQHLNPFLRDAYLVKYGDTQPATMVVGKDVFLKRARRQPDFAGLQAGIIVRVAETGEVENREGMFYDQNEEQLVGGWAKVYVKGYTVPFYSSVPMEEYIGRKKNGEVNGQWASKPATMIRKVALAQALREAFPEGTAGLYAPEEISEVSGLALDETPVTPSPASEETEQRPAAPVEDFEPKQESISDALFG